MFGSHSDVITNTGQLRRTPFSVSTDQTPWHSSIHSERPKSGGPNSRIRWSST